VCLTATTSPLSPPRGLCMLQVTERDPYLPSRLQVHGSNGSAANPDGACGLNDQTGRLGVPGNPDHDSLGLAIVIGERRKVGSAAKSDMQPDGNLTETGVSARKGLVWVPLRLGAERMPRADEG